jgi:hypothetical protein
LIRSDFNKLYSIFIFIRAGIIKWAGHAARKGKMRNSYGMLFEKLEGKGPLGKTKPRSEDNIKMDLKEMGCERLDYIHLAQDRVHWLAVVNMVMNIRCV